MKTNCRSAESLALRRLALQRLAPRVFALLVVAVTPLLAQQDGQWPMYSGQYSAHRFSPLTQITPSNVSTLRPAWVYQPPGTGSIEATPVVVNGVMYVTAGPTMVAALDLKSGKPLWEWTRPIAPSVLNLGFPRVNRGVAYLDNMVYVGTLDGYLFALDARAGTERWSVHVGENPTGHAITAAPLVVDNKVIVGISGGEAGIRGFLDAYDAKTGKQLWRYWTIPSPGEPGSDTWPGDSWVHGGGATWLTGSYDPQLKLLYWGTGNPGPDWNGDSRLGDNFGTSSLVALDIETGKLRWSFQFTPHDVHDWDANQIPVLVDTEINGRVRQVVVAANRNAFFYVLDRRTGEYLLGQQYAKQTWAKGLDEKGRPILIPDMEPTEKGTLVYPSLQGSTNWASPSYSPQTNMLYVPVREMGSIYFKTGVEYKPGTYYTGGSEKRLDEESWGAVRAIDVRTGKAAWDFPLPTPTWAGVMATAGGLVFSGSNEGNFYALDAKTGKPLWQFQTGGAIRSGPMSYSANGKQYVAVAGGHALFVFALE
ncbi:MAG: PQQ-dependent dehydrogenase, methanol/ethanol family [Acidobacteria bacterium]|nr:PQQ-dependent dehydrogenase, methanol/ethanol family [Acidobacteriota bacterium]